MDITEIENTHRNVPLMSKTVTIDIYTKDIYGKTRGNHLPVSAARWQHGSQICLATFI
jgi:hypothetical protein